MERAIKVISVERGFDPREFTLFSFGGAGGLHAAELARGLDIGRVFVPQNPGMLSAAGMLLADVIKDYSLTVMLGENQNAAALSRRFQPLAAQGRRELLAEGVKAEEIVLEYYLDMRYRGQSYELMVPFAAAADADPAAMAASCEPQETEETSPENPDDTTAADAADFRNRFHRLHEQAYGYANRAQEIEIVNLRLRARGRPPKPEFARPAPGGEQPEAAAALGERPVFFAGAWHDTRLWQRQALKPGNRLAGPAIVLEYSSTIIIPPFARARVDAFGNLILEIEPEGRP